jgi:hypothetical protein
MDSNDQGIKRARTQQQVGAGAGDNLPGREQLLLASTELQTRLGRRYCDETELMPLLLAHGLVRRVRTIQIEVRPLGGDSFKITVDASLPTVGEAKAEIARSQGTARACQELYRVAERADGMAVREDDADPELLDDEGMLLGEGDVVAMAVKVSGNVTYEKFCIISDLRLSLWPPLEFNHQEPPLLWRTFPEGYITLGENGAVATQTMYIGEYTLMTTGTELTEGRHYWEVELLSERVDCIFIGISRPNLDPKGQYFDCDCTDGWFIDADDGTLWGNRKNHDDEAGECKQGDRVGVLLDLNDGSLRFFKNGVQHGPGYAAGSVTGPVVAAVQMYDKDTSLRLLPNAEAPANA